MQQKVYELRINSHSAIREAVAHLTHEMNETLREGKELIMELWEEDITKVLDKKDWRNGIPHG